MLMLTQGMIMYTQVKKLLNKIVSYIETQAQDSERQMMTFGIFGTIAYPLFAILNLYVMQPKIYENIYLRLIAGTLCLGLALKAYWPIRFRKILPFYWYFTLLYGLSFFFTFMMLKNQASNEWLLNLLTVLFFTILVIDWISVLFIFAIGGFIGWLCYDLSTAQPFVYAAKVISYKDFIGAYIVTIILGVLFSRNKSLAEKYKIQAMKSLAANIAHELRTPLAAIQGIARGIGKYFSPILEGYELAKKNELPVKHIGREYLQILRTGFDNIDLEVNQASTVVEMLLVNIKHPEIQTINAEIFSIKECVQYALLHYPFLLEQARKVEWKLDDNLDFNVQGNKMLSVHVLYNLLRNALYFIDKAGKGIISIWLEQTPHYNILHFKDTASGIPKKYLPYIFDRFFSKSTHQGTGIGLSFCKMVMENMRGKITCDSVEGSYTHFKLSFPIIKNG